MALLLQNLNVKIALFTTFLRNKSALLLLKETLLPQDKRNNSHVYDGATLYSEEDCTTI